MTIKKENKTARGKLSEFLKKNLSFFSFKTQALNSSEKSDKKYIPASIAIPSAEIPDSWGRILEITPYMCVIMSRFEIRIEKTIILEFEMDETNFKDLRCRIKKIIRDNDGYFYYDAVFIDSLQRSDMRQKIMQMLAK